MVTYVQTDEAAAPFSAYSQAVSVPSNARTLHLSGQVGVSADGVLASGEEAQHEQCWRNILAILKADGMEAADIVHVQGYITSGSGTPVFRQVRDRMLRGARPACTLVVVAGLAHPDWLVEIAVVAARAEG